MLILNDLAMKPKNNQPKIAKTISILNKSEIKTNSNTESLSLIANKIFNNMEIKYPKLENITNVQKMVIINKIINSLKNNSEFQKVTSNLATNSKTIDNAINVTFNRKNKDTNINLQEINSLENSNSFFSETTNEILSQFSNLIYIVGVNAAVVSGIAAAAAAGYWAASWFFGLTIPEAIDCTTLATTSGILAAVAIPLSTSINDLIQNNYIGIMETVDQALIQAGLKSSVAWLYGDLIATQVASVADEMFDPDDITNMASIATILSFMVVNNLTNL